jgi:hypothetical protein
MVFSTNGYLWLRGYTFLQKGSSEVADSQDRRVRYLELLYEFQDNNPGLAPSLTELLGYEPDERQGPLWIGTMRALRDDGLINLFESGGLGGTSGVLTDDGRVAVESLRLRRNDRAERWKAALNAVLQWAYDQSTEGSPWLETGHVAGTDYALFEGIHLPESLLYRAAGQLNSDHLVEVGRDGGEMGGPLMIQINRRGRDCIEAGGDVTEFVRGTSKPQATNVWNINTMSGNLAVDSTYITQSVTSNVGIDADQLKVLLQAMSEALPVLALADDQAAVVRRNVERAEEELQQSAPDPQIVRTLFQRALGGIGTATQSAVAFALTALAKYELAKMGIPIEP